MFYVAYVAATIGDFLIQKGITGASWKLLLVSFAAKDDMSVLLALGIIVVYLALLIAFMLKKSKKKAKV